MQATAFSACFLANVLSSYLGKSKIETHRHNQEEFILVEKVFLNDVYDAYLYISTFNCIYASWLVSKSKKGKNLGWEFIPYKIASKIFPKLKNHAKEYLKNEES